MTTVIATPTAVYADSHCSYSTPFTTQKARVVKFKDERYLVAGAGDLDELEFLCKLLQEHGLHSMWKLHLGEHWPPDILENADTDLVIVTENRDIFILDKALVPIAIHDKVFALGSGSDWARAAIDFGKSPLEALEYAATKDHRTRGPFHKITFRSKSNG